MRHCYTPLGHLMQCYEFFVWTQTGTIRRRTARGSTPPPIGLCKLAQDQCLSPTGTSDTSHRVCGVGLRHANARRSDAEATETRPTGCSVHILESTLILFSKPSAITT